MPNIVALVAIEKSLVAGGAPIFYARDKQEQDKLAAYLMRLTGGVAHDLENGVYVIVKH